MLECFARVKRGNTETVSNWKVFYYGGIFGSGRLHNRPSGPSGILGWSCLEIFQKRKNCSLSRSEFSMTGCFLEHVGGLYLAFCRQIVIMVLVRGAAGGGVATMPGSCSKVRMQAVHWESPWHQHLWEVGQASRHGRRRCCHETH